MNDTEAMNEKLKKLINVKGDGIYMMDTENVMDTICGEGERVCRICRKTGMPLAASIDYCFHNPTCFDITWIDFCKVHNIYRKS